MNSKISDKDKKDWETFLSNKESLPDKDKHYKKIQKKNSIILDLHGFSLTQANKKVENLINQSYEMGIRKLLIITGKGLHSENEKNPYVSKDFAILKHSVRDYIRNNKELMTKIISLSNAAIKDGGAGAFCINLKKKL